jgi:palmitoyltransferase
MSLGLSRDVWVGLTNVLTHGIPALERQSFPVDDPGAAGYNASTSGHIAANLGPLLRDIDCINDLCIIARNMLATKQEAQDLAADTKFDQHVLKLIDVCNRVCARGYDGEANTRTEERWQRIINACESLVSFLQIFLSAHIIALAHLLQELII